MAYGKFVASPDASVNWTRDEHVRDFEDACVLGDPVIGFLDLASALSAAG